VVDAVRTPSGAAAVGPVEGVAGDVEVFEGGDGEHAEVGVGCELVRTQIEVAETSGAGKGGGDGALKRVGLGIETLEARDGPTLGERASEVVVRHVEDSEVIQSDQLRRDFTGETVVGDVKVLEAHGGALTLTLVEVSR
jgi:hypothetical protein